MVGERVEQGPRAEAATPTAQQPLMGFQPAGLLERVGDDVLVSAETEDRTPARASARAGPMPSARSRSVVGQKHACTARSPSRDTSSASRWVACTTVVAGPRSAGTVEQHAVGVHP